MPVFNIGLFCRFELTRMNKVEEQPQLQHSEKPSHKPDDAPPPYYPPSRYLRYRRIPISSTQESFIIPTSTEQDLLRLLDVSRPSHAHPSTNRKEQLNRYLIEIIALTFNTNFDDLNAALYKTPMIQQTKSILSRSECKELVKLSSLVRKLHGQIKAASINIIDQEEEREIQEAVLIPAGDFRAASLDWIGWYGAHLPHPTPWRQTVPGYWETGPLSMCRNQNEYNFIDSMRCFKTAIWQVSPNEEVRRVLIESFEVCRQRLGMKPLTSTIIFLPVRDDYYNLFMLLSGEP